jgi:hypothetical protein
MVNGLEKRIDVLAKRITIGSHWYDELSKVKKFDEVFNLGLSDESIKKIQLDLVFRSLLIATSEKHLQSEGYTHLKERDIINSYIRKLYEYKFASSLKEAKKLVKTGLKFYKCVKDTESD